MAQSEAQDAAQDDDLRARIEAVQLQLPRYSRQALINRACKQHNDRQRAKARELKDLYAEIATVSPQAHPNVLARICVNYLRQLLEARYPDLAGLRGQREKFELYSLAKAKMLGEIARIYPWLAQEAERQQL